MRFNRVKKQIDLAAAANANPDHWFINFTSASHSPPTAGYYPWDFATGGGWGVNHLLSRELVQHTPAGGAGGHDGDGLPGGAARQYRDTSADRAERMTRTSEPREAAHVRL